MTNTLHINAKQVLDFWFDPNNQPNWFAKSDDFDNQIRTQFNTAWQQAKMGELAHWRTSIKGRLAEIIVLDQFSRNLARDNPDSFAQDGMALVLAQEAIKLPDYHSLDPTWQKFVIMPFMHSESKTIHQQALPLFTALDDANTLDFEHRHKAIIDRFGRYPHRNAILERQSTPEEIEFLQQDGSSF